MRAECIQELIRGNREIEFRYRGSRYTIVGFDKDGKMIAACKAYGKVVEVSDVSELLKLKIGNRRYHQRIMCIDEPSILPPGMTRLMFKPHELDSKSVVRIFRTAASDGKNYNAKPYSLDALIAAFEFAIFPLRQTSNGLLAKGSIINIHYSGDKATS